MTCSKCNIVFSILCLLTVYALVIIPWASFKSSGIPLWRKLFYIVLAPLFLFLWMLTHPKEMWKEGKKTWGAGWAALREFVKTFV